MRKAASRDLALLLHDGVRVLHTLPPHDYAVALRQGLTALQHVRLLENRLRHLRA